MTCINLLSKYPFTETQKKTGEAFSKLRQFHIFFGCIWTRQTAVQAVALRNIYAADSTKISTARCKYFAKRRINGSLTRPKILLVGFHISKYRLKYLLAGHEVIFAIADIYSNHTRFFFA